ncbi:MAG TPA: EpsI family protein [Longimicrobiales bacterium]
MSPAVMAWAPAVLLGAGAILTVGVDVQRALPLRTPLESTVPSEMLGFVGRDIEISDAEQRVAGMTDYLMRVYSASGTGADQTTAAFSIYVGYYDQQIQGRTIHSPKNCLPGAGWEALASRSATIDTPAGAVVVNRYLLQRDSQRALVLYWYQGRGRIEANEYRVKLDLLRDAALRRRSDEALVRVVVPVTTTEDQAFGLAADVAREVIPAVRAALPI